MFEMPGKAGVGLPMQKPKLLPKSNAGVIFGLTVTVKVVDGEQVPEAGLKIYVPEF